MMEELENEPVFIVSQMRAGYVLSDDDVTAIQAVLSELDSKENDAVETFQNGRKFGLREIGGQELVDAVQRADDAWVKQQVRKAMDRMDEKWGRPTLVDELRATLSRIAVLGPRYAKAARIAQAELKRTEGI